MCVAAVYVSVHCSSTCQPLVAKTRLSVRALMQLAGTLGAVAKDGWDWKDEHLSVRTLSRDDSNACVYPGLPGASEPQLSVVEPVCYHSLS